MKIVFVGGGIGGLAAAISCVVAGHDALVLEQRNEFTEIGAGIQLAPNAFNALDSLGVGDRVRELAVQIDELRLMDGLEGRVITRLPLDGGYKDQFENPYMVVHRTDLYYPLLDACRAHPAIELRTSAHVTGYTQDEDTVTVHLADGQMILADALIGADGLHSVIRQQLVGDGSPRISGHSIYRAIVPMEKVPKDLRLNSVMLWAGPKWHFVHYPIASGKYMNLAATRDDQADTAVANEATPQEKVLAEFSALHTEAKRLLQLGENWKKWVLCDRNPVEVWSQGRVTLLGDAAHPMLQYLAQGACMALEDAVVLGDLMKDIQKAEVAARLVEYNQLRRDRTARVVTMAREMGEHVYHAAGMAAKERNTYLGALDPRDIHKKIDWLHGMRYPFTGETTVEQTPRQQTA